MNVVSQSIDLNIRHELSKIGDRQFRLDVKLQLPANGITAVFGESGSGKTTLLRCLAGLEKQLKGEVRVKGALWHSASVSIPTHKRRVGYVFQEASLFPHLNVEGNIRYGIKRSGSQIDQIRFEQIINLMGLSAQLQQFPQQLSGGERQRVAIARVLVIEPELILMDEPLASLDTKRKQEILPYLESIHEDLNIPIIYVTHAMDEVTRLADHVVVLREGKAIANGEIEKVLSDTSLPFQVGEEAGSVLQAVIAERDENWHLARVEFKGGDLWVKDSGDAIGKKIRIRVLARDVSLALEAHGDTSILNRLAAIVEQIEEGNDPSMMLVRLKIGESKMVARVSRRSAHQLSITEGMKVWAQIKGVAILR